MLRLFFFLFIIIPCSCTTCKASDIVVSDSSHVHLIHAFDNLSKKNNDISSLSELMNHLLKTCESLYTTRSIQYAECLLWCAHICIENGDNKQGKELMLKSKQVFHQYGRGEYDGRDSLSEIFYLDLKSRIEYEADRDYYAVRLKKKSCTLKNSYFGQNSEPYLNSLLDLSRLYAERLKYKKSNFFHNQGYGAYVERIKSEFCSTSESERSLYWQSAVKYINRTIELGHKLGRKSKRGGKSSLASAAYNAMLLSKGLLLNTTLGFEEYINNSGNTEAKRNLAIKKRLSDQQADQQIIDSLDYVILRALQEKGQGFQLPHLSISWNDVAQKLTPNDLAIEFYKTTSDEYGAILLKNEWKSPKIVRLKKFVLVDGKYLTLPKALNSVLLDQYSQIHTQSLWNLSKAIWTDDIIKYFPQKGQGRIFFSADGELLIKGIEYLPFVKPNIDGSYHCISDLFQLYRLSSTRQLAVSNPNHGNTGVAVFGGLKYDMEIDVKMVDDKQEEQLDSSVSKNTHRSLREAVGLEFLKGSKRELESIAETIGKSNNNKLKVDTFIGAKGTETSFKRLSGKKKRIIHISTHGFFYDENDLDFDVLDLGDNPLVRNGLYFSGADNKLFGEPIPKDADDGLLTSLEISNLDLRGLDLVALSACDTGKGVVKGDGVFGLQRGFKMAGTNSILMSLWKVDDDATCMLMTEFYKNWIAGGKTKHAALEAARKAVRSHKDMGWDDPKYWAAFILLDGLD